MKVLIPLNFKNYKDFQLVGKTLVYLDGMSKVEADPKYQGGIKVAGRSVKALLEDYLDVYLISEIENEIAY